MKLAIASFVLALPLLAGCAIQPGGSTDGSDQRAPAITTDVSPEDKPVTPAQKACFNRCMHRMPDDMARPCGCACGIACEETK